MNPVKLAQSFLLDIAAGVVVDDDMRSRARQLAHELEPWRDARLSEQFHKQDPDGNPS